MKERVAKEVSWFITIVFGLFCHWLVVAFGSWLNPDVRVAGQYIWMGGAVLLFAVWALGVFFHGAKITIGNKEIST